MSFPFGFSVGWGGWAGHRQRHAGRAKRQSAAATFPEGNASQEPRRNQVFVVRDFFCCSTNRKLPKKGYASRKQLALFWGSFFFAVALTKSNQ